MSIADWATTISGFLAIAAALGGAFHWVIKRYLIELRNNGGGSVKDKTDMIPEIKELVREIHVDLNDVKVDLARLEGKFEQHVQEHNRG